MTLLAVLIVLSMAVRQKQVADLAWLSEPVENPPVRFDLLDGLLVLLAFLALRDLCSGLLNHAAENVPMAAGGGYIIGAWSPGPSPQFGCDARNAAL